MDPDIYFIFELAMTAYGNTYNIILGYTKCWFYPFIAGFATINILNVLFNPFSEVTPYQSFVIFGPTYNTLISLWLAGRGHSKWIRVCGVFILPCHGQKMVFPVTLGS